jgi:protein SCO1/2
VVAQPPPAIVVRASHDAPMRMPMPAARQRPFVPVLREGDAVPATALVDQAGRPFDLAATHGRTTVVSFVYTRCRDARMCPLVAAKFARMQRQLRGTPIRLVTVTLDPGYDTPRVLARYGAAYGADPARWSLVTGPPAAVDELVARLGVTVERPGPGVILHTEAAVIIDARGRVARFVDGATWLPDDLVGAAQDVAAIPVDPWLRLRLWLASSASALCGGRGSTPLSVGAGLVLLGGILTAFAVAFGRAFIPRGAR